MGFKNNNTTICGVLLIGLISLVICQNAGYQIGTVKGKKLLREYGSSKYYQIQCDEMKDNRPIKLLQLVGTHYEVGYAYGALIGPEIVDTYHTFLSSAFSKKWQIQVLEIFLDWQFDNVVQKQIPKQYKEQLKGIGDAAKKIHHNRLVRKMIERTLVISSYPGDFEPDIFYTLFDEFLRFGLKNNQRLLNLVENNLFSAMKKFHKFLLERAIHCSFFATWGKRTQGMKLFTMRNLDWHSNSGMNKNKIIFVWKIKNTIPHTTLGFPGIIGALTGMSAAGLTVHQAGLDSMKATEFGFQWTLRLRYILMHAVNLQQARQIWKKSNNTLGMNHMVASAADLVTGQPVFVIQTMRNYTAWFTDNDKREKGTIFIDPKTNEKFQAGFAMDQAVFRTNHAYDPEINKYRTKLPSKTTSTIKRYFTLKDDFLYYQKINKKISQIQAVNITANVAHKGSDNPYICPVGKDNGTNVISVTYVPADLKMFAGFQYGSGDNYKTACCGVYLQIDMNPWFQVPTSNEETQEQILQE